MIVDAPFVPTHVRRPSVSGSLPDGTVVSSNSARCHRDRTGEKSGRHLLSGGLPGIEGRLRRSLDDLCMSGDSTFGDGATPSFSHEPVMLAEILAVFANLAGGTFLDATLGGAGHSAALLAAHPSVHLLGIDRDPAALRAASIVLEAGGTAGRATLRHARFDAAASVVIGEGIGSLAGALFDLGVSSHQLDAPERGFSYRHDAPLDMRMDTTSGPTAADIVNGYDEARLARLIADNSDERWARRIAAAIVAARPIMSTVALADAIVGAIPAAARRTGGHPAKRTFQAIRIEVNAELGILRPALESVLSLLAPGARLAVLTYHSGEDRIVKEVMRAAETGGCTCPPALPCRCGAVRTAVRVRAPRQPGSAERLSNPRARSARLRVVERITATGEQN